MAVALVAGSTAVRATGTGDISDTTPQVERNGVDFDAACLVNAQQPLQSSPPPSNSIASTNGTGCPGLSTYDGSTRATDLVTVKLESDTAGNLHASFMIGQALPPAGSTDINALDVPGPGFLGVSYKVLFQNKTRQTNLSYHEGGCSNAFTGRHVADQHGSWKDGYHFFIGFDQTWDGSKWVRTVKAGEYGPGPDGGFFFVELGTATTSDTGGNAAWRASDVAFPYRAKPHAVYNPGWNVKSESPDHLEIVMTGVHHASNATCSPGSGFKTIYGAPADVIGNVKGLTSAIRPLTSPVTVPSSLPCELGVGLSCMSDIRSLGGFLSFSDTTSGWSSTGLLSANIPGIAYSAGFPNAVRFIPELAGAVSGLEGAEDDAVSVMPDTLGDGPTCPTPTLSGVLPQNPFFNPDAACQFDDDPIARGLLLPEFWDTSYGFSFDAIAPQNDCGTGGDAGGFSSPTSIILPKTCSGEVWSTTDGDDAYQFSLTSGDTIRATIADDGDAVVALCLYEPSGSSVDCTTGADPISHTADTTGTWTLRVTVGPGEASSYTMSAFKPFGFVRDDDDEADSWGQLGAPGDSAEKDFTITSGQLSGRTTATLYVYAYTAECGRLGEMRLSVNGHVVADHMHPCVTWNTDEGWGAFSVPIGRLTSGDNYVELGVPPSDCRFFCSYPTFNLGIDSDTDHGNSVIWRGGSSTPVDGEFMWYLVLS